MRSANARIQSDMQLSRGFAKTLVVVFTLGGVCLGQMEPRERPLPPTGVAPAHPAATSAQKPQTPAPKKPAKTNGKTAKQPAEATLPPPRPLTPEQLPATKPAVTYRNGQLAIVANNSTMSEVLNQVRAQTGAQFEMSGVSAADRVYAKLGPGAPKDVLAALLDGTRFNFAILGSVNDPNAVARVVLMPKTGGVTPGGAMVAAQPQPQVFRQPQPPPEPEEEEMPVVEEEPPPPVEEQPSEQPQQQGQPGQVKTPEQLLQELQQMQQQNPQQNPQQYPQPNPPQQQIPDREIPD